MPTISTFYGIIIRMYFAPGEHPPPHFHVYYAEYTGTVDIRTCELIEGNLPRKQIKFVLAWSELHTVSQAVEDSNNESLKKLCDLVNEATRIDNELYEKNEPQEKIDKWVTEAERVAGDLGAIIAKLKAAN